MSERFYKRLDWLGAVVSLATIALGVWDRLHGPVEHGDYLILLGTIVAIICGASLIRRARA